MRTDVRKEKIVDRQGVFVIISENDGLRLKNPILIPGVFSKKRSPERKNKVFFLNGDKLDQVDSFPEAMISMGEDTEAKYFEYLNKIREML